MRNDDKKHNGNGAEGQQEQAKTAEQLNERSEVPSGPDPTWYPATVELVPVKNIKKDPSLAVREVQPWHVENLLENLGHLDPLVLSRSENPELDGQLVDGHQRLEAMKQAGWTLVPVVYVEVKTQAELLLEATRRNCTHGLPLNVEERQSAALELWRQGVAEQEIAKAVQRSLGTVQRWLSPAKQEARKQRDRRIQDLYDRGISAAEIPGETGVSESTVERVVIQTPPEEPPEPEPVPDEEGTERHRLKSVIKRCQKHAAVIRRILERYPASEADPELKEVLEDSLSDILKLAVDKGYEVQARAVPARDDE